MNKEEIPLSNLINRLNNFVNQLDIKENLNVTLSENLKIQMDGLIFSAINGIQIYRITQESINNAVKHVNASFIQINLNLKKDLLIISINDDGKSFDVDNTRPGNGLTNLKK